MFHSQWAAGQEKHNPFPRLSEVLLVVVISAPTAGCGTRPPQVSPAAMEAQIDAAEQRLRQAQTADGDDAQPIASRKFVASKNQTSSKPAAPEKKRKSHEKPSRAVQAQN